MNIWHIVDVKDLIIRFDKKKHEMENHILKLCAVFLYL